MDCRLVLLVAVLAATAGCNILPAGSQPAPDTTRTLTPVPVPDQDGTATPELRSQDVLPPGVARNGSVELARLVRAHTGFLDGVSYTRTYRETYVSSRSGPAQTFTERVESGETATLVARASSVRSLRNETRYVTECCVYVRGSDDNGTRYNAVLDGPESDRMRVPVDERLGELLPDRKLEVAVVERNGRRYVRLYAPPGPPPANVTVGPPTAWNYTATVYVTPGGFVRSATATYRVRDFLRSYRVSIRFRYTRVGNTTVPRPDWATRATATRAETSVATGTTAKRGAASNATSQSPRNEHGYPMLPDTY